MQRSVVREYLASVWEDRHVASGVTTVTVRPLPHIPASNHLVPLALFETYRKFETSMLRVTLCSPVHFFPSLARPLRQVPMCGRDHIPQNHRFSGIT